MKVYQTLASMLLLKAMRTLNGESVLVMVKMEKAAETLKILTFYATKNILLGKQQMEFSQGLISTNTQSNFHLVFLSHFDMTMDAILGTDLVKFSII